MSTSPDRVVHLCYSGPSGASGVAINLARRLADRLPQAVLLFGAPTPRASITADLDTAGIPWTHTRKRPWADIAAYTRVAAQLTDLAGPRGIAVVHGLRLMPVLAALRLRARRPRVLMIAHGPTEELSGPGAWRAIGSVVLADRLLCVTGDLRERITDLPFGRCAGLKAAVAVNGIDTDLWRPGPDRPAPSPEDLRLCAAGPLIPRKRFDLALETVAELRGQGWAAHLTVCGDGPDRARLQEAAERLALGSTVDWRGLLDPQELRAVLVASHVFVHPSRSEGLSLALLEALACGCPAVICRESAATPLDDARDAVVFAPADGAGIARGVLDLVANPQRWAATADAARRAVVARFSLERQAEEFLRLVNEMMKKECSS